MNFSEIIVCLLFGCRTALTDWFNFCDVNLPSKGTLGGVGVEYSTNIHIFGPMLLILILFI